MHKNQHQKDQQGFKCKMTRNTQEAGGATTALVFELAAVGQPPGHVQGRQASCLAAAAAVVELSWLLQLQLSYRLQAAAGLAPKQKLQQLLLTNCFPAAVRGAPWVGRQTATRRV